MAKKKKSLYDSSSECAVIAGDLHLLRKPGMWSGRSEISGDDIYALQQVVDIAKDAKADLYLLGDVLDAVSILPRPLVGMKKALTDYPFDKQCVRYIQGQHELVVQANYENYPWLSMIDGTEHMAAHPFKFLGFNAFALDFFPQAFEDMYLSTIPTGTEVLFLHGTADMVMPLNSHFTMDKIPESVKVIFAGDYHVGGEYIYESRVKLLYTGTTWFTESTEPIDKYVYMVTKNGKSLDIKQVQLRTRPIYKVSDLDMTQDTVTLPTWTYLSELPEKMREPVIIVNEPIDQVDYAKLVVLGGHTHTTGSANPDVPSLEAVAREEEMSNAEILERYCDAEKYPAEFAFTLDVIENPVEDAIQRLKTKCGIEEEGGDAEVLATVGAVNLDGDEEEADNS